MVGRYPVSMGPVRAAAVVVLALGVACGSATTPRAAPTTTVATAASPLAATSTSAPAPTTAAPCAGGAAPATYAHVLIVVMENHGYADVAAHSPYLNRLAGQCGLARGYKAVAHPSLPNYLALASGSTQGVTDDCTSCSSGGASIFQQLGADWRSYQEDMPSAGYTGAASGKYAKKHNPAAYFTSVAAAYATQAVPMGTTVRRRPGRRPGPRHPAQVRVPDPEPLQRRARLPHRHR